MAAMEMISVPRAAREILKLAPDTVYEQIRAGVYPPGVIIGYGKRYKFNRAKLVKWLDEGGTLRGQPAQATSS